MIKIYITLTILLLTTKVIFSQTYEMTNTLNSNEKNELITMAKELFAIEPQISYNLSTNDPLVSFSDMKDWEPYDEYYLKNVQEALKQDSLNPILLNNLGTFYNATGNSYLAKQYFQKSYTNLDVGYFDNDSAFFYSFRGLLKFNLGIEDAFSDLENSLRINPNDSIAISFYPLFLIQKGRFADARKLSIKALDEKNEDPVYAYVFLIMTDIFERLQLLMNDIDTNEKLKAKYRKKDYDKIIDFKIIDKYSTIYKENLGIQNARNMADILALMIKIALFEQTENFEIKFEYTSNEIKKLKAIENWLTDVSSKKTLNEYALNKNLGFTYFMLNNRDKSIEYFNKAIRTFPATKRNDLYSASESFDALLMIYFLTKDDSLFRKTLEWKIESEPDGTKSAKDHKIMAIQYFLDGQTDEAEKWCEKAKDINSYHFETLRLLAHLYFIKGYNSLAEYYAQVAIKHMQSSYDEYEIGMQTAIYFLYNGDAKTAYSNIEIGRESLEGDDCELCDKLLKKYIKITAE